MRRFISHPAAQLLILVVVALIAVVIYQGVFFTVAGEGDLSQGGYLAAELGSVVVLGLVFLLARYVVERRPYAELGLPRQRMWRDLYVGLILGSMLVVAAVSIMVLLGWYRVDEVSVDIGDLAWLAVAMLLVAAWEEAFARGLLQRLSERWLGTVPALALSSVVFGLLHIGGEGSNWLPTLIVGSVAGLLFGAAFVLSRSLWLPIGIHAAWNFTQGVILPPPDPGVEFTPLLSPIVEGPIWGDGSSIGPAERGLVGLTLLAAVAVILLLRAVRAGRIYNPPWLARLTGTRETSAQRLLPDATPR